MRSRTSETGGWVYCLTNESMPGIVKIGMTTRPVDQRVRELSASTSSPTPFNLRYSWPVNNPALVEAVLHRRLRSVRVNDRREFFAIEPSEVALLVPTIIDEQGGLRSPKWDQILRHPLFLPAVAIAALLLGIVMVWPAIGIVLLGVAALVFYATADRLSANKAFLRRSLVYAAARNSSRDLTRSMLRLLFGTRRR